ncbi:membrane protein [Campylobacter sputorum subsp. bubulus]|uniref:Membrane protein n=1 Tax=Campylobacter sputorum subsp. sputorum TaxID=32024 RepID=A0A381DI80_9BACT|nr:hypothetical protein [Campylobacter sputorum]ASM35444.1 hypothetical protein CSPUT_1247 [Campylobacter sputorum aubsp. sputorum RM3237]KAB0582816.1 hypothetical protein F7P64_01385 [Campylobacter sputorum subsp. sputorum]QEL05636.1 hypothetical protein CSPT_1245 [Campylobacter sputorum subsp. sputorum]SUX08469.1 membrane protein [Campylobacter sputorum subsp. bubulus]SUX10402.1 membrane protein [Campylobacter sputorum subsp. sputorum]
MTYSLIKPKKKPIFSLFSRIWIGFIVFVFIALVSSNLFIKYQNNTLSEKTKQMNSKYAETIDKIHQSEQQITTLTKQKNAANSIYATNLILKQSIKNLFDLVPDSITLDEVYMDKTTLIIKGVTPTKNVFEMLLAVPLKSIFTTSNTTFYQTKNGWLNFVNTNKIDDYGIYDER